ncbi:MAG: energy transducer TonB [Candidatus Pacebacteria bacterium]|nr:energy transducer TonB [Candidatus Paceibacterota bacterium]
MSDLDQRPIPVLQRQPHYPFSARHRGIEGHVDVRFVVGVDGRVRDVRVVEGAPPEVFNEAALAAVRDWRFKPARVNDRNVAASMQVRIRFALER